MKYACNVCVCVCVCVWVFVCVCVCVYARARVCLKNVKFLFQRGEKKDVFVDQLCSHRVESHINIHFHFAQLILRCESVLSAQKFGTYIRRG